MELQQLKKDINSNSLRDSFFIFKGNGFLADQYSKKIASILGLELKYIDDLKSYITPQKNIFDSSDDINNNVKEYLNIYKCDELNIISNKLNFVKNLIIIADNISNESQKEYSYNIVEMPKIEDWMVKDYAYIVGEGIDAVDLDLFLKMCDYDIYRVSNELDKLKNFSKTQRKYLFKQMLNEGAFNDLSQYNIFDLTNAIQIKDLDVINKILSSPGVEIDPLALISLLYQNFKRMIMVWFDKNPTPDSTGLKSNQIWAIRNLPKNYSKDQLIQIFKFLTSLDVKLKQGNLPNINNQLIDYVISSILSY